MTDNSININQYRKDKESKGNYTILTAGFFTGFDDITRPSFGSEQAGTYENAKDMIKIRDNALSLDVDHFKSFNAKVVLSRDRYVITYTYLAMDEDGINHFVLIRIYTRNPTEAMEIVGNKYVHSIPGEVSYQNELPGQKY